MEKYSKCKYPAVSFHPTLHGQLEVDWEKEYQNDFFCPHCDVFKLKRGNRKIHDVCKLDFRCGSCRKRTSLTCRVPAYIYRYCHNIECPNPLCSKLGHDGQKGWVFKTETNTDRYKCYFCKVDFNPHSTGYYSWVCSQAEDELMAFSFDQDTWDLRHFYDETPFPKSISFREIHVQWYQLEVKKYLYYLIKGRAFSSPSGIRHTLTALKKFGEFIEQNQIKQSIGINREMMRSFLETYKSNKASTINQKLSYLERFFNWLQLDVLNLVRSRDYLRESDHDPDWLDEFTRQAIHQDLTKIPAPIARQYLLQEYIAARPDDASQIAFNCLLEENGKWYVKFNQGKQDRWHKIPASREIRKIIEDQQQWIRKNIGLDYLYLFCHFRGVHIKSYPNFPSMKPLPAPTKPGNRNQMVRIIRMLIEKENIRDVNGQIPHFTGKITRSSKLQEVRVKYGIEAAQLYADHVSSRTTFQYYAPPTREQIAEVDLPFQKLLLNPDNKFLPWQSLPESLLENPKAHELDLEIAPRLVVYGHCALNPKTPCPVNLFPKCYGCYSFRPSTGKLPLYERQYEGEQQRLTEAENAGAELASEEAKATITAMDKWLPELRRLANG